MGDLVVVVIVVAIIAGWVYNLLNRREIHVFHHRGGCLVSVVFLALVAWLATTIAGVAFQH